MFYLKHKNGVFLNLIFWGKLMFSQVSVCPQGVSASGSKGICFWVRRCVSGSGVGVHTPYPRTQNPLINTPTWVQRHTPFITPPWTHTPLATHTPSIHIRLDTHTPGHTHTHLDTHPPPLSTHPLPGHKPTP